MVFSRPSRAKTVIILSDLLKVYKRQKAGSCVYFAFFQNRAKEARPFLFALHNLKKMHAKKIYFQRKEVTKRCYFYGFFLKSALYIR